MRSAPEPEIASALAGRRLAAWYVQPNPDPNEDVEILEPQGDGQLRVVARVKDRDAAELIATAVREYTLAATSIR
jgi:hypothetical protein